MIFFIHKFAWKSYIPHRYLSLDWSDDEAAQLKVGGMWFWVAIQNKARVLPAPSTDLSTVIFRLRRNTKTSKKLRQEAG